MKPPFGDFDTVKPLIGEPHSSLHLVKHTMSLTRPVRYCYELNPALHSTVASKIGIYDVELKGVPVAYNEETAKLKDTHGSMPVKPYIIECEYVLFRPILSDIVEGTFVVADRDTLCCFIHHWFSAAVSPGALGTAAFDYLKHGDYVKFIVTKLEIVDGDLQIAGTLLEPNNLPSEVEGIMNPATTRNLLTEPSGSTVQHQIEDGVDMFETASISDPSSILLPKKKSKKNHKKKIRERKDKENKAKKCKNKEKKHRRRGNKSDEIHNNDQINPGMLPIEWKTSPNTSNIKKDCSLPRCLQSGRGSDNCSQSVVPPSRKAYKSNPRENNTVAAVTSTAMENESHQVIASVSSPKKQKMVTRSEIRIPEPNIRNQYRSSQDAELVTHYCDNFKKSIASSTMSITTLGTVSKMSQNTEVVLKRKFGASRTADQHSAVRISHCSTTEFHLVNDIKPLEKLQSTTEKTATVVDRPISFLAALFDEPEIIKQQQNCKEMLVKAEVHSVSEEVIPPVFPNAVRVPYSKPIDTSGKRIPTDSDLTAVNGGNEQFHCFCQDQSSIKKENEA